MQHVRAIGGWNMEDNRDVTIHSARVMDAIAAVSIRAPSSTRSVRRENLPANELMGRRMETGVLARAGAAAGDSQLAGSAASLVVRRRARHRLGAREWAFFESRGERRGTGGAAQNSWFSPAKISETESSRKIRRIESVRMSAEVSCCTMAGAPLLSGTVSVTTMPSSGEATRFAKASPAKRPCVATA